MRKYCLPLLSLAFIAAPTAAFESGSFAAAALLSASAVEEIGGISKGARSLQAKMTVDDAAVDALIKDLSASDSKTKIVAMFKLYDFGAKANKSIPGMIRLLKDNDKPVRDMAEATLKVMGNPAVGSLTELLELLDDSDPRVFLPAEKAILSYGERGQLIVDARRQQRAEDAAEQQRLARESEDEQNRLARESEERINRDRIAQENSERARQEALSKKWSCTATCFYTTRIKTSLPSGEIANATRQHDRKSFAYVTGCEDRSSAESDAKGKLDADCERFARSVTNEIDRFYVSHRLADDLSCE